MFWVRSADTQSRYHVRVRSLPRWREFRVSPRNLPCGVSLPGGGTTGVGVDERVEDASGRPPNFNVLNVDQVAIWS